MKELLEAKRVFDVEINALEKMKEQLDKSFLEILNIITECKGKIIITGMGKSGHIATKIAATFSSLGTPSFYLHPAEALHGDLGMITEEDVVVAISYSGESDEVVRIIPSIKLIGARLIGITGNKMSSLAQESDTVQILPEITEACFLGLAPTSSTTVSLCYGDALAIVASNRYGFNQIDFGKYHPAGALGKRLLLRVKDVMISKSDTAIVDESIALKEAVVEMSARGLSIVTVIKESKIIGILTDGDLRRLLEEEANIYSLSLRDVMTVEPYIINENMLAVDALKMLKDYKFSSVPVISNDDNYVGVVTIHSIIQSGVVL